MQKEVTFDAAMCCALAQAFTHHPQMISDWISTVGPVRPYADILVRTLRMTFLPSIELIELHRAFALAERDRLEACGGDPDLRCEHDPHVHRDALNSVIRQLFAAQAVH